MLANRSLSGISYLFLFTLLITFFLGRVFCGWACPLGFLNDLVGKIKKGFKSEKKWFALKYYLLFFTLSGSLFSLQLSGFFDPISFLIRSLTVFLYPFVVFIFHAFIDLLYSLSFLRSFADCLYDFLKEIFLPARPSYFYQSSFIGALFIFILGLNLLEKRFWCKHLCPLGALLGLVSFLPIVRRRVKENCTSCYKCTHNCTGGLDIKKKKWFVSECIECFECERICSEGSILRGGKSKELRVNLERRAFFLSVFFGGIMVPIMRLNPRSGERQFNPRLIRPPGSVEESEFLRRCIRCGECMKVCPTGGLQPSFMESGIEGIWTPILIPKIGYCEFSCTMCGQVCPVGAIKKLSREEKKRTKIGLAFIDKNRCLPYAFGISCIVCEEVCPTPKKAIFLEEGEFITLTGKKRKVKLPKVDPQLCVGCGICEAKCPVSDFSAIYVTSAQESRSEKKRLLFEIFS